MTKTKQNKTATTDAVELNDAALDRAAGGAGGLVSFEYLVLGSVKTLKDGTSNTFVKV